MKSTHPTSMRQSISPWIVWSLVAAFFYYKYLIQVSPGVMSTELMQAFHLTGAGLGQLAACFFYGYLLMQIPVGLILDRFSPGKTAALALLVCSLSILAFAQSQSLVAASISRFLIGTGAAFAAVSCFKIASLWFPPHRFALICGLSMTAGMLGAVGGEGLLAKLIADLGWRQSLTLIGWPGLLLAVLIWALILDKPSNQDDAHSTKRIGIFKQLKNCLGKQQTWLLCLFSGLAFAPVTVFGGLWGASFLSQAYQIDTVEAANHLSLIFLGFAIGCPLTGWASDYLHSRKPLMLSGTIIALTAITIIIRVHMPLGLLAGLLFIFGLSASCFFLCFSMLKESHPIRFTATVLGFMNTFDSLFEALIEPLIGKLLDLRWTGDYYHGARRFPLSAYHFSFATLPILLGLAILVCFWIKETYPLGSNTGDDDAID